MVLEYADGLVRIFIILLSKYLVLRHEAKCNNIESYTYNTIIFMHTSVVKQQI